MFATPSSETRYKNPRVAICTINPGVLDCSYVESLLAITSEHNKSTRPSAVILKRSGALIQLTRTEVTNEVYSNMEDIEWVFWIDADIQFPSDVIDRLYAVHLESGAPLVGGMYIHPMPDRFKPSVFYYKTTDGHRSMDALTQEEVNSMISQGHRWIYADGVGTGCMMVHRSVLQRMAEAAAAARDIEPWFTVRAFAGVMFGEDLAFCHRARELGFKIAVHLDLELGHVKPVVYKHDRPVVI